MVHTDNGEDKLFIVQSGEVDCYKVDKGSYEQWRTFSDDQVFGVFPSLFCTPKSVVFTARGAVILYSITRELYTFLIRKRAVESAAHREAMIQKIDFIALLDDEEHSKLIDIITEEEFGDSQMITQQNDPIKFLYIITSGSVAVKKPEGKFTRRLQETREGAAVRQPDWRKGASVRIIIREELLCDRQMQAIESGVRKHGGDFGVVERCAATKAGFVREVLE
jgi:signal-transduction protein with cAMP-binding, CBS, and nucleotidyltransferase domain